MSLLIAFSIKQIVSNDIFQLTILILYTFSYILVEIRKRTCQSNTLDGRSLKRLRERNAVQQGGQLEDTAEEPVVLVESALQNTASVYRKRCNQEHCRNLLENLKTNLTELKDIVVNKVLVETQVLKWYVTLKLNFHKANDPAVITEPLVVLRTEVFKSVNVQDIDAMFHAVNNELTQKIHDYQANGSGCAVDPLLTLTRVSVILIY